MTAPTSFPARLWAFVRLGRPLFLVGGVVFHLLGVAMALSQDAPLDLRRLILGQVAVTATQLMTHYANELFDLEADRANRHPTPWSGGSRVLPEGLLAPRVALIAAVALAGIALLAAAALGALGRLLAIPIIALALILSAEYSAPPLRLHSMGLGEVAVAVIVPGLTPLLGYYLQTGTLDGLPLLAVAPLMLLQGAAMLTVHFPDAEADARVGKRTLVVRLGRASARLHNAAILAAYAVLPLVMIGGLSPVVVAAVAATAPLAAWQIVRVHRGAWNNPSAQGSLAFGGIALLITAGVAESLAFLALAGR